MAQDVVLVAGAGPVGLTAAHSIARHGVPVRIIDLAEGPTTLSKALVVWRRTMQVLDATIAYEKFLAAGHEAKRARFVVAGKPLATIPLANEEHLLPAGVFIPQSETEKILIAALAEQNLQVAWQTKLVELAVDADGVTCQLETPHGPEEVRCSWLIGCEGAHSVVRHHLNLDFPGESVDHRWILGDVEVDADTDPHEMIIENGPGGIVALFPVGVSRWRIIANGGPIDPQHPRRDPSEEELQAILNERTSGGWQITESYWRGEFRINERQVENYVHGRALLAGDAAHVHSPAGGQGMNTGIQDAANLAWKVALAWQGAADASLIETYQQERHPIGRDVLRATGRMLRAAMISNPIARHLRDVALHIGMSLPAVRHNLTEFLSEETITLRGSRLCGPGIKKAAVQPGDAFPDLAITVSGRRVPATELLRGHGATCIALGDVDCYALPDHFGASDRGFPLAVVRIGPGTEIADVDDLTKALGLEEQGVVLVRPDGVVGTVGTDANLIRQYFTRWNRA